MEMRKVEIEYRHFEPGERVRLIHDHSITGTVRETRPPTSVSKASVLIKYDHSGTTACFYCEAVEPIPEEPITEAEIGQAVMHPNFTGFDRNETHYFVRLHTPWKLITGKTKAEALEALVRELRKRDAK